jgi:lysozyme family protein
MSRDPIEVILEHEGGYVDHPADKGGPTNWGITIDTYSRWLGRRATIDEVRNMKKEEAREIYESQYLTGPRIHTLPEPPRTQVLDMAVNHGPRNGIRMLQRTINLAGFGPADVDGAIGPQTRRLTEQAMKEMGNYFNNALVEERLKFYNNIIERNPSQRVFIRGWTRRAESFRLPV